MNLPKGQTPASGFSFNQPTIVALLFILSFFTGLTGIIGVILAYVWRGENPSGWEASHYTYHIRSFWIGMAGMILGFILMIVVIGILIMFAAGIWVLIRSVVALLNAQKQAPMPDPQTLWI
jgi:uncharacterized membrane protein